MQNTKKFTKITTIEDDAPSGDVNFVSISFLTPNKIESIKHLDVLGFKVHNGYNTFELADDDVKKIKENNKSHDVYISQVGKIYAWDDATKTDEVEYGNDKLNELEKQRLENVAKVKMVREQLMNDRKFKLFMDDDKEDSVRQRMQKKLYDKGLITKKELELIQEENKPVKLIKEISASLEKIDAELDECYKTDYLDENDPTALKYGCISIFSPKNIKGLKILCFKVRGIYQTPTELTRRVRKLESLYPNDKIYTFEVGKWNAFSETENNDPLVLLKRLKLCNENTY